MSDVIQIIIFTDPYGWMCLFRQTNLSVVLM